LVRVNDRGPQNLLWEFDLSEGAAIALGIKHLGIARVTANIV
jgi:rare lipoprotein A (peptidoglycan hydrolase)